MRGRETDGSRAPLSRFPLQCPQWLGLGPESSQETVTKAAVLILELSCPLGSEVSLQLPLQEGAKLTICGVALPVSPSPRPPLVVLTPLPKKI